MAPSVSLGFDRARCGTAPPRADTSGAHGVSARALGSTCLPKLGTLILLFLLFTRVSDVYPPAEWPISINQIAVAVVFGSLVYRLARRRQALATAPVLGAMLAYAAAIGLSALGPHDHVAPILAASDYLREVIIALLLVNLIDTTAALRRATWMLVAAGAVLAGAAVLQAATGQDLGGLSTASLAGDHIRLDGPFGCDSNHFAQLLLTVVPLALYRAWDERRMTGRLIALGALLLFVAVIVRTFSRSGLLGLLVALGAAIAMRGFNRARLIPVGLALLVMVSTAPDTYWRRIGAAIGWVARPMVPGVAQWTALDPPPGGDSLDSRWGLGRVGWTMFREHPLTGVGKGNYYSLYAEYARQVDPTLPGDPMGPHNALIHVAAQTGVLGLAAFTMTVLVGLCGLRTGARRLAGAGLVREAGLLAAIEVALYAYLVTAMFLNDNTFQRYLWLLIGLAAVGRRVGLAAPCGSSARTA